MNKTEQLTFVFQSDDAARDYSHWFWRTYGRAADDLDQATVKVYVLTDKEKTESLERAKRMQGRLIRDHRSKGPARRR